MKLQFKQIIASIVLMSFSVIVFFSFSLMMHGPEENMPGDCPFSNFGASICPQNIVAIVNHHISALNSFLSVFIGLDMMILMISLVLILFTFILLSISPPQLSFLYLDHFDLSASDLYKKKINAWLSLFENSPSII
ncbi:MAG: hypothetical protein WCO18_01055 [bacterium]